MEKIVMASMRVKIYFAPEVKKGVRPTIQLLCSFSLRGNEWASDLLQSNYGMESLSV
jgi:hypothetical protein